MLENSTLTKCHLVAKVCLGCFQEAVDLRLVLSVRESRGYRGMKKRLIFQLLVHSEQVQNEQVHSEQVQ